MQLDDLKERYKVLPMWARLVACGLIGLAPAAYVYIDESEALQIQLDEGISQQTAARQKFETSRNQKANIRKLEEQLQFTKEQLFKAKKSLPDSYRIEDVLERVATIAKETGVQLVKFKPGGETLNQGAAQYVERAIATEIVGRFSQVAAFFDRVVHLESSIFLKKIQLERQAGATKTAAPTDAVLSEHQRALAARRDVKIGARFDLAVYRSMTDQEAANGGLPPSEEAGGVPDAGNIPPNVNREANAGEE